MAVVATVVAVVFTLVGAGIFAYAVWERRWVREFEARAVTAPGVVRSVKASTTSGRGPNRRPVYRYRAVVDLVAADGRPRQATTRWPTLQRPTVGTPMAVRYDPEHPRRVVPADGAGSRAPATGRYVTVGVLAIVIGWVVSSVLRAVA